jgi:hypothetical protein
MSATIIPFQVHLPQALPTIEGNVDYRDWRDNLLHIDQELRQSGLEAQLLESDLQRWLAQRQNVSGRAQQNHQLHSSRALRCNLARELMGEDFRGFAARLADSPVLQFFCRLDELGAVKVPSKSTLQRYDQWWPEPEVREVIHQLLIQGADHPETLHLPQAVDLESAFLDTTCLAANIHYPVDWVLFRDATRTLMKAVRLIRDQGLKHRMDEPETFLTRINRLCIEMTHAGHKKDFRRARKKIFRQIDSLVSLVRNHARRYRDLLDQKWEQTDWTRPQAEVVLRRMDQVLDQLPKARQQARQRILEEKPVANEDKILSLYEPAVRVIVRKKAGAEVEFGNTFFLAENPQGLIIDWELFEEQAPADSVLLPRSVGRMKKAYGPCLKAATGDRGFDSQTNRVGLASEGIYNGVCPRCPEELKERGRSWKFKRLQRRRGQTEGRIGIVKNVFLGGCLRGKGFAHRQLTVTWTVLAHNLWVMARMRRAAVVQPQAQAA